MSRCDRGPAIHELSKLMSLIDQGTVVPSFPLPIALKDGKVYHYHMKLVKVEREDAKVLPFERHLHLVDGPKEVQ